MNVFFLLPKKEEHAAIFIFVHIVHVFTHLSYADYIIKHSHLDIAIVNIYIGKPIIYLQEIANKTFSV